MAFDLSTISKKDGLDKPPICMFYGVPGINKTTLCAGSPDSIFMVIEEGLGSNSVNAFNDGQPLNSYQEVLDGIEALATQEHGFKNLNIDSLSALETLIYQTVCQENGLTSLDAVGYGKGYALAETKWVEFFEWLRALREQTGMGINLIAHSQVITFKNPEGDDYDHYQPDLDKRAYKIFLKYCDIIAFINYKVVIKKENAKDTKGKAVNRASRVLHLSQKPAYVAKNRYNLPETLEIPDLAGDPLIAEKSWQVFSDALDGAIASLRQGAVQEVA